MNNLMSVVMLSFGLGVALAIFIAVVTGRRGQPNYRSAILTGLVAGLLVLGFAAMRDSFTQVEAGSVAVVKQFGRIVGVFEPGLHWKAPFMQTTVPYRTQEILYETAADPSESDADYTDIEVDTATADGQQIHARYTVRFRIDPERMTEIVNNLGTEPELVEKVVKASSRVHVRNILKQYPASDLYSGNVERAQQAISDRLKVDFETEGLELVFFGLRSIQFTEAYRNAVEQKQIEKENIVTKENLAKQAEFEKQRTITQAEAEAERQKLERIGIAEGAAEATRVQAIADAEATRLKAQAQAEANKLIAESLDESVISWQAIQNWSGDYPLVLSGGDGSGSFILPGELFVQPERQPESVPAFTP
jgi:regulator of protease activity HflC (stomatin/prohibitin superfamily)